MSTRGVSMLTEKEMNCVQQYFKTGISINHEVINAIRIADTYDLETIYQNLNKDSFKEEIIQSSQYDLIAVVMSDDIFDKGKVDWVTEKALLKIADFVQLGLFQEVEDIINDLDEHLLDYDLKDILKAFSGDIVSDLEEPNNPQMRASYHENFHKAFPHLNILEDHFGENDNPNMTAAFSKVRVFAKMKSNSYLSGQEKNFEPVPKPQ